MIETDESLSDSLLLCIVLTPMNIPCYGGLIISEVTRAKTTI